MSRRLRPIRQRRVRRLKPEPSAPANSINFQIGAVKKSRDADKLLGEVKKKGFKAFILAPPPGDKNPFFRVQVGPFSDAVEAESARKTSKQRGISLYSENEPDFDPHPPLRGTLSQRERESPESCPSPSGRGGREAPGEGRSSLRNLIRASSHSLSSQTRSVPTRMDRTRSLTLRHSSRPQSPRVALISYIAGFVFFAGTFYWMTETMIIYGGLSYLSAVGIGLLFAVVYSLCFLVFGLGLHLAIKRFGTRRYLLRRAAVGNDGTDSDALLLFRLSVDAFRIRARSLHRHPSDRDVDRNLRPVFHSDCRQQRHRLRLLSSGAGHGSPRQSWLLE